MKELRADPPATEGHTELRAELKRFRYALRTAGLKEATVHHYLMGSTLFVRWLAGDYVPGPGRSEPERRRKVE